MPIRAYAVPTRNDLSDGLTQFNDVFPNTSQTNTTNPVGQTAYINQGEFVANQAGHGQNSFEFPLTVALYQTDIDTTPFSGAPVHYVSAGLNGPTAGYTGFIDGLTAWFIDNICGDANVVPYATQASSFAQRIACRVAKGQSLNEMDIVDCINATSTIGSGPAMTLNAIDDNGSGQIGVAADGTFKTAAQMVEEVIRICAGDIYRVQEGAVCWINANTQTSFTLTARCPMTLTGTTSGPAASGFLTAPNTNTTAPQTFPASADFVPRRTLYYGGEILASAQEGQLHEFATHQLGEHSFHFKAAKLADGQTAATYGATGSAHALQRLIPIDFVDDTNPAELNTLEHHGLAVNDVIRLRQVTIDGTVLTNGVYKVSAVNSTTNVELKTIANAPVDNTGVWGNSTGGYCTMEASVPTAAVVTATDSVNIPSTGSTAFEFRGVVVYDNEGNVLS